MTLDEAMAELSKVRKATECEHPQCHDLAIATVRAGEHHAVQGQHGCCSTHSGIART